MILRGMLRPWNRWGTNCNFVTLLGHGSIRQYVMHGAYNRAPDELEQAQIENIIRHNMDQGAWGISFGLDYVPSRYASMEELVQCSRSQIKRYDAVSQLISATRSVFPRVYCGILRGGPPHRCQDPDLPHLASAVPEAYDIALKAIEEDGVRARIDVIPSSVGHCTGKERMPLTTMALSDELFSQGIEGVKRAPHTPEGRAMIKKDNYTLPVLRTRSISSTPMIPIWKTDLSGILRRSGHRRG